MENKEQKIKNTTVTIYENTPFLITSEDVILFNSLQEQINYFDTKLKKLHEKSTYSYIKDTNYITVEGKKEYYKNATYIRINNGDMWIYGFIVDTLYINKNTTTIIFEIDYFNTYQQYIHMHNISGLVEQGHLKRYKNNKYNVTNQSQGFDVGSKDISKTYGYRFDVLWLVIVAKPTIEIGIKDLTAGVISGTYKAFHYYLLPIDRTTSFTLPFKYENESVLESHSITKIIKLMTNSFNEDQQLNTVNQVVNVYTTKSIGVEYEVIDGVVNIKGNFDVKNLENLQSGDLPSIGDGSSSSTSCPIYPVKDYIKTSDYGYRSDPFTGKRKWHNGVDFAPKNGGNPPIYAVQDAKVITKDSNTSYGNRLELKHTSGDNHITLYAHLKSFTVNLGDTVKKGQIIGYMGTTGNSTGVHLHFEVHKNVDKTIYGENGTSSNPLDYLNNCVESSASGGFKGSLKNTSYLGGSAKEITLTESEINNLISACKKYKILPSGVICQLWLESNWGNSAVAKNNNNWSGITWVTGGNKLDPEVTNKNGRERGQARPSNEGGYYTKYKSLEYFFKDYLYLLGETGYKVVGKTNIEDYTKGLFKVGGARYDYAASGYNHYITLMKSIDKALRDKNSNYKNIDKGVF